MKVNALRFPCAIERASEETVQMLIDSGILYVDENGVHVVSEVSADE